MDSTASHAATLHAATPLDHWLTVMHMMRVVAATAAWAPRPSALPPQRLASTRYVRRPSAHCGGPAPSVRTGQGLRQRWALDHLGSIGRRTRPGWRSPGRYINHSTLLRTSEHRPPRTRALDSGGTALVRLSKPVPADHASERGRAMPTDDCQPTAVNTAPAGLLDAARRCARCRSPVLGLRSTRRSACSRTQRCRDRRTARHGSGRQTGGWLRSGPRYDGLADHQDCGCRDTRPACFTALSVRAVSTNIRGDRRCMRLGRRHRHRPCMGLHHRLFRSRAARHLSTWQVCEPVEIDRVGPGSTRAGPSPTGHGPGPMRPGPGPSLHGPMGPGPTGPEPFPGPTGQRPGPRPGPGPGPMTPPWADAKGPFSVAHSRPGLTLGPLSGRQPPDDPGEPTGRKALRHPRRLDHP